MKHLGEQKALDRLVEIQADFRRKIADGYEHRAKDCLTCEVQGSCCLDAHFVNVHISRLEAVSIRRALDKMPMAWRARVETRIKDTVEKYGLTADGDSHEKTYACPLFEKGLGCLVHAAGKPVPCVMHACYENSSDLPPDHLQTTQERLIETLNSRVYGAGQPWLPLPVAIARTN